jgi:hypothetical protein
VFGGALDVRGQSSTYSPSKPKSFFQLTILTGNYFAKAIELLAKDVDERKNGRRRFPVVLENRKFLLVGAGAAANILARILILILGSQNKRVEAMTSLSRRNDSFPDNIHNSR